MKTIKSLVIINIVSLIVIIPVFFIIDKYVSGEFFKPNVETSGISDKGIIKLNEDNTSLILPSDNAKENVKLASEFLPSSLGMNWDIIKSGTFISDYQREEIISFPPWDSYNQIKGITTFRGNNYRNSASYGYADIIEKKLEQVWDISIGSLDGWSGVGWNGQPSIVKWDEEVKNMMNISNDKKSKSDLKEVIYATLDGNIYFMDLEDGQYTRPEIKVGSPHKGSVTIDPRGYPLLYAGQGIDKVNGRSIPIGYRIYNLIDQKQLFFINGIDKSSFRSWGAFDSNPVIHSQTDTMFECGENGILYSVKLNTDFNKQNSTISINPDVIKYRYKTNLNSRLGTENSIVAYKNLLYFADNDGVLQCLDINTLRPIWTRNVTDDTDSTIALEDLGGSKVFIYTSNEVDHQGAKGYSYVRKINALSGELIWEKKYKCSYDYNTNGGSLASPVLGQNDIQNLAIFNIAKAYNGGGSKLIGYDKKTGEEIWIVNLDNYCWSSPVAVYTKEGKSYIIQCDSIGQMYLIEGATGMIMDKIKLGSNIEASPAIYENMIVVGTRGQKIFGIRIK